ncbi:dihydrolipoamide acetyltransferase family protein [Microbacterium sp. NPDC076911]|uniref:dihydrolipoamide acetyltransferase family protein n=1 Tax=Microbacterium sp. NPDC076911 TaxID=3154958 RepID=UPI00341CBAB2
MTEVFRLPDLGEGLPEAELVQWLVAEGDEIVLNQTLAEVETAKAIVELPSPFAGRVGALHAAAGEVIAVGSPVISIETDAGPGRERDAGGESEAAVSESAESDRHRESVDEAALPNLVGYGAAARSAERPRRRARRTVSSGVTAADTAVLEAAPHDAIHTPAVTAPAHERPRSTPPVRALARRLGVDLALVDAAGAAEIISREDVEAYAARMGVTADAAHEAIDAPKTSVATERTTRSPIRGVRKHTAAAMVSSAFTAPHVTTFLTVDVTATSEMLSSFKNDRSLADHRIGILAVAAKAVCLALGQHPSLNSKWDDAANEIVEFQYVNLGIAAATGRGLVVPNIRDADRLTLAELADAIAGLADVARSGKTAPVDMTGGTFSITNVGVFGVDAGTPILNPGEAGILALGAVRSQPWEHHGEMALRDVMTLSLSFDHRLVDGEQGAKFLRDVGRVLEMPGRAMLLR